MKPQHRRTNADDETDLAECYRLAGGDLSLFHHLASAFDATMSSSALCFFRSLTASSRESAGACSPLKVACQPSSLRCIHRRTNQSNLLRPQETSPINAWAFTGLYLQMQKTHHQSCSALLLDASVDFLLDAKQLSPSLLFALVSVAHAAKASCTPRDTH